MRRPTDSTVLTTTEVPMRRDSLLASSRASIGRRRFLRTTLAARRPPTAHRAPPGPRAGRHARRHELRRSLGAVHAGHHRARLRERASRHQGGAGHRPLQGLGGEDEGGGEGQLALRHRDLQRGLRGAAPGRGLLRRPARRQGAQPRPGRAESQDQGRHAASSRSSAPSASPTGRTRSRRRRRRGRTSGPSRSTRARSGSTTSSTPPGRCS